jgi:hypothetical protein
MADIAVAAPSPPRLAPLVFAGAVFTSAALVFLVEPMVAKSILPLLGGSPSVWNACMAFFQIALLAGYLYAHLLQRLARPRTQLVVHLAMLGIAALFLPIEAASAMGAPPVGAPTGWLFRILLLSVGMPFAVLSATAPLLQSWYARASHSDPQASNPYTLYAASNLGSMLALLSYPTLVEPLFPLSQQRHLWAGIYVLFCAMIVLAGALMWRGADATPVRVAADDDADAIGWGTRAKWVGLAALPSSLMLGVTTYISNDIASVPLFWVIPLALYLLTFVIAFQAAPLIGRERALLWQAVFVPMAAGLYCIITASLFTHLFAYLGAFFLSALVCHQGLARSRPHPKHLTEFYLLIAFGGVVGGVFNAFVAPVIFHTVLEFPAGAGALLSRAARERPRCEVACAGRARHRLCCRARLHAGGDVVEHGGSDAGGELRDSCRARQRQPLSLHRGDRSPHRPERVRAAGQARGAPDRAQLLRRAPRDGGP